LAALVGVGQSMYQVEHYVDLNTRGTAQVLDALVSRRHAVRKMVVASSMSIYGEGAYRCRRCGPASASLRGADQLERRDWEVRCPACAEPLEHQPTSESKPLQPTSVYAQTKRHQEELCLLAGRTYGLPVVALRYFNTYGPRQALSNPYTGIGAIFAARLLNDQPPVIFEDGRQSRDFIHVRDVAEATCLALERDDADGLALNVGTGVRTSVHEVARLLSLELKGREMMEVTGRFRQGDIRHCYADCSLITRRLGFAPAVPLAEGLAELARGVADARAADAFPASLVELERRGLVG
jgi:dTDP-L-rhamnose 4-epimerase